jgi:hypothetical protein
MAQKVVPEYTSPEIVEKNLVPKKLQAQKKQVPYNWFLCPSLYEDALKCMVAPAVES